MKNILDLGLKWPTRLLIVCFSAIVVVAMNAVFYGRTMSEKEVMDSYIQSSSQQVTTYPRTSRDPTIPWLNLFKFVPNNVRDCSKLFNGNATLPADFSQKFAEYENELQKKEDVHVEGYTALFPFNYKAYLSIAKASFLKTICETGFNAGHSTFGWLTINPNVHVYSFDIGKHAYSRPMTEHLQKIYPGRLNVTWGDSTVTLPKFRQENPSVKCDLIIIDGGHSHDVCKADFYNFKDMAHVDNIVILDDYPTPTMMTKLGNVWEQGKQNGELSDLFSCSYRHHKIARTHGFAVGRYLIS